MLNFQISSLVIFQVWLLSVLLVLVYLSSTSSSYASIEISPISGGEDASVNRDESSTDATLDTRHFIIRRPIASVPVAPAYPVSYGFPYYTQDYYYGYFSPDVYYPPYVYK